MPKDAIVWHNCGLIRWIEDEMERSHRRTVELVFASLGVIKRR